MTTHIPTMTGGTPTTTDARPLDGTGQALYRRARELIPGGTQLLSKRPEMFLPDQWPAYYSRARGAECWDLDGRRYLDFATNGIGAAVLGFADPDVDRAVMGAIGAGQMCTLNCPEEVELAELMIELHPWAEMVRYQRGGGEAMSVAIRIARAATGRDRVLFCGYHGWHDWYLSANLHESQALDGHLLKGLEPAGVPRGLTGTMLPFHYNDAAALESLASRYGDDVAAIVMEPGRDAGPAEGFLERVRAVATRLGAVLIFDEVTSGWRLNTGGLHLRFGVSPDVAVFAKAMGNGYPIAAVIGTRAVMDAAQRTFISSTSWTERIGPTAALAMIRKHRERNVGQHLDQVGRRIQEGWASAARDANIAVHVSGITPLSHVEFAVDEPAAAMTLFIQEMLDRGFLAAASFYSTFAHEDEHVESYLTACREAFGVVADATRTGDVTARLRGPVKHSGFQRLT